MVVLMMATVICVLQKGDNNRECAVAIHIEPWEILPDTLNTVEILKSGINTDAHPSVLIKIYPPIN